MTLLGSHPPRVPPWVWGTEARGFWGLSAQTHRDNPEVTQVPHLSTFYPLKYLPLLCFCITGTQSSNPNKEPFRFPGQQEHKKPLCEKVTLYTCTSPCVRCAHLAKASATFRRCYSPIWDGVAT